MPALRKKSYDQPRQHIKEQRHYFANKGSSNKSYGFSSSHVWMWELDYKESWVLKNWCFWTVVLEKTLENSLDSKILPVYPKGNPSWIVIGWTDAEDETPICWPLDAKNWLNGDLDAGKYWRREEKGTTEDQTVGWHHQLNGYEFEKILWVGDGQEAWHATVHGVVKSQTQLSNWMEVNWTEEQLGEIRKPFKVNNAKKQRKTIEWGRLEISARKSEIPTEHFIQRWAQ